LIFDFRNVLPKSRLARIVWAASLLLTVALLLLPVIFKLDGKVHADWQQFLGRFHPLAVHLPIGLILLVPLLELAGIIRPALREAAAFVLALCIPACLSAVILGYLLAYGSGEIGATVTRHMWGGITLTVAVLLCSLLRPAWSMGAVAGYLRIGYPALLTFVLLLLSWTAHQGGSLTHGDTYLTQYLPVPLKHAFGAGSVQANSGAASDSFYAKQIHPLLDKNCVSCHGESSVKGGLRLDSYQSLMKGGEEGPVILPGAPDKSLLLQRVTLPSDHKKFMPAEGKPPLKAEEIVLLKAWIAQGASPSATSLAGVSLREEETPPPPVGDYSKLMPEIENTAKAAGITVTPVSRNPGDGLILNTIDASANFGDAQLTSFQKFAPYFVEVSLARTSVTDASIDTLAKFSQLRVLHLEDTAVTGAGLQKLSSLTQLRYINLSGTRVSEAAIAPLHSMKQLRHIYLYNTPAQPVSTTPSEPQPSSAEPAISKAR
jgi:Planctomycete cytochrome C